MKTPFPALAILVLVLVSCFCNQGSLRKVETVVPQENTAQQPDTLPVEELQSINSLIGTWESRNGTYEFNSDGTFEHSYQDLTTGNWKMDDDGKLSLYSNINNTLTYIGYIDQEEQKLALKDPNDKFDTENFWRSEKYLELNKKAGMDEGNPIKPQQIIANSVAYFSGCWVGPSKGPDGEEMYTLMTDSTFHNWTNTKEAFTMTCDPPDNQMLIGTWRYESEINKLILNYGPYDEPMIDSISVYNPSQNRFYGMKGKLLMFARFADPSDASDKVHKSEPIIKLCTNDECEIYAVFPSGKKEKIDLSSEASWENLDDNLVMVNYSCGSPCSYSIFVDLSSELISESFFNHFALDTTNRSIAYISNDTIILQNIFNPAYKFAKQIDISPVTVSFSAIQRANFINNRTIVIEYLTGDDYNSKTDTIQWHE